MISAIIVISLLSLLVATEPETAEDAVPISPEPPVRPEAKKPRPTPAASDRLAA